MKYLALILIFAASSAFAGDSTSVVWTSDTTYVRGGIEYWDPIESHLSRWEKMFIDDPELERDYNEFWMLDMPRLKRPDLDNLKEEMVV